ncbi:4-hydroxy-3-methylbut-2-enyl diphosphate reductase [Alkaliflexus imshenetskii]|uniref:4-hydroxy-3-methylbut-2-enyl diphosphate reductase n=1 Tax=Alkaliflexus imshenetskii TaxID=286730 RepID=UPI00047DFE0F|nr:4-hydroxy-3-methylbut-2-enyl diphosphate reductase [Alkaliflexus imshenetskii]
MVKASSQQPSVLIEIDSKSGFCFGVSRAVKLAESEMQKGSALASLGDIVHNDEEINRLKQMGMQSVSLSNAGAIQEDTVLFRAHGEPPSSYDAMRQAGKKVVDATCPVVLKLQQRVRDAWQQLRLEGGQLVIYGKQGHAEVIGLVGQTNGEALVVQTEFDLALIDKSKPTVLFAQTTMSYEGLERMEAAIRNQLVPGVAFHTHKTICAQVGNRVPHLKVFAANYDVIFFVGGEHSSNGKVLFTVCEKVNPRTFYISSLTDINENMLTPRPQKIGVCGATSTPQWLMEQVADKLRVMLGLA